MIVVNINSGLGNQMYHYALYLRLKNENPQENVLIDNSIYKSFGIDKKYEIERIFNLKIPNVSEVIPAEKYGAFIKESKGVMQKLPHNWLSKGALLCSQQMCQILPNKNDTWVRYTDLVSTYEHSMLYDFKLFLKRSPIIADVFYKIKPQEKNYNMREFYSAVSKVVNVDNTKLDDEIYMDLLLRSDRENRYYVGNYEPGTKYFVSVAGQVRKAFTFPSLDAKNLVYFEQMQSYDSVSVHLRRGDHLQSNNKFFLSRGYYYKAIRYMKSKIQQPKFFLFSDDIKWCKENFQKIGFNFEDNIVYVDGNGGEDSYRDMQLMSLCKHNIIPISTFSWWASYLNENQSKIVIAPKGYWADAMMYL